MSKHKRHALRKIEDEREKNKRKNNFKKDIKRIWGRETDVEISQEYITNV